MRKDYDISLVLTEENRELLSMKEAFIKAEDKAAAAESYFDDIDEYVTGNVPALVAEGNLDAAWKVVIQAYAQLTDEDIENYDDNEMHEGCKKWMNAVLSKVEGMDDRKKLLSFLIWVEKTEAFPCWVKSASADLVHDLFTEPELLQEIALWYKEKYDEDPVENGAFWKGKLRDVYERLDSTEWKNVYDSMTEADPVYTDLVYAECIARRRDPRCLGIWDKVEAELGDLETEEDVAIYYSILWARLDWYDLNGTDEEAETAANNLKSFIAMLHHHEEGEECGCGCGHHHEHEEEHECHCGGHHHDHEEHECKCGHHHDEDHECCCGKHH